MMDYVFNYKPPVGTLTKDLEDHHFEMFVTQDGWTLSLVESNSDEVICQWGFDEEYLTDEDVFEQGQYGEGVVRNLLTTMGYDIRVEICNG